jgi:glycosyltransferase involved in cell wall biosynthesis
MARVLFLDPYHGPSHAALSRNLRDHSRHQVTLLTLPPRKWKWRMRGSAFVFEKMLRDLPEPPEILVATDMLNLPELLALSRDVLPPRLPVIIYFHENQITYPLERRDERDFHFGLANIHSALAADTIVFNSRFHREEFLGAIPPLIKMMPDHRPEDLPERIRAKSEILGVPIDVAALEPPPAPRKNLILWNHRWEDDKDPESFFRVVRRLDGRGADFKLMVLGESFRERPACFDEAARDLAHRIEHWGYLPSREDYLEAVARCRLVISTARHEFYGLAVREAIALGCYPILPRRVVYPEMVDDRDAHLYDTEEELADLIERALASPEPVDPGLRSAIAAMTVGEVASRFDAWFDRLVSPT